MSTALTEVTVTETAVIAAAEAALAAAESDTFPTPSTGAALIKSYRDWLRDDVETYADVEADRTHPAAVFEDLADGWPDDAKGKALSWLAEDVGYGTGALAEIVRRFCGDETADSVLAAAQAAQQEGER